MQIALRYNVITSTKISYLERLFTINLYWYIA
jgi:hypothetical protein